MVNFPFSNTIVLVCVMHGTTPVSALYKFKHHAIEDINEWRNHQMNLSMNAQKTTPVCVLAFTDGIPTYTDPDFAMDEGILIEVSPAAMAFSRWLKEHDIQIPREGLDPALYNHDGTLVQPSVPQPEEILRIGMEDSV